MSDYIEPDEWTVSGIDSDGTERTLIIDKEDWRIEIKANPNPLIQL